MSKINLWDFWITEFYNAKAFFTTKGNLNTKETLKAKWQKEFFEMFKKVDKDLLR